VRLVSKSIKKATLWMSLILNLYLKDFMVTTSKESVTVSLQLRTFLYMGCITIPAASKAVLQFSKVSVKTTP
jgi:hypothetical protein